jgi:uncharacterized membrane protein
MQHFVGPGPNGGPFFHVVGPVQHGWFWFGWLMPLLFFALLAGLIVWVVLRTTRRPAAPAYATGWAPPPARFGPDPALEQARLRYARGELSREDFFRVAEDLRPGGPRVEPPPSPPEAAPPEPAEPGDEQA